jgi:hypothetical protein
MDLKIVGLIVFVVIIVMVLVLIFVFKKKEPFNGVNKKIIKYFGANYCPYSNTSSMSYKVMKDLEDKYKTNIEIKYYWTDADGAEEGKAMNVKYVPTILNSKDEELQLALPEGTDTKEMTNEQLKELLLTTVFNKI